MRGTDEAIHKIKRIATTSSLRGSLSEAKTTKQSKIRFCVFCKFHTRFCVFCKFRTRFCEISQILRQILRFSQNQKFHKIKNFAKILNFHSSLHRPLQREFIDII
ncbi:hypothetical protein ACWIUD_06770 [Helicobacter sp. 23-1044]